MLYQGKDRTPITRFTVHCSATRREWWAKKPVGAVVNEIRRWHVNDNGWNDIGYHRVIHRPGTVGIGRDYETQGAHVGGHNAGSIAVCLIGGHGASRDDSFSDHFTPEQEVALIQEYRAACEACETSLIWEGHNQYANKGCPGFDVTEWLYANGLKQGNGKPWGAEPDEESGPEPEPIEEVPEAPESLEPTHPVKLSWLHRLLQWLGIKQ